MTYDRDGRRIFCRHQSDPLFYKPGDVAALYSGRLVWENEYEVKYGTQCMATSGAYDVIIVLGRMQLPMYQGHDVLPNNELGPENIRWADVIKCIYDGREAYVTLGSLRCWGCSVEYP